MDKAALRKTLLGQRLAISAEDFSQANERLLLKLRSWILDQRRFKTGLLFMPFRAEPDITALAAEFEMVGLPVVGEKKMEFHPWKPGDVLQKSRFGTLEPDSRSDPIVPDQFTLIVVPALAFTEEGYRLGYGGGFYDRYLASYPAVATVGVCFPEFLRDLPKEAHDLPVGQVFY